jgi:Putative transposase, YhgA-like
VNPPIKLTEAQYRALKKKLHQAHDKVIKLTLNDVEAMRELLLKIVMPLLPNVRLDLDDLTLDNTSYIRPNLNVFFSDIVYLTTLIDEESGAREPVKVGVLIEHKSEMPTELQLRLQATDYINAIMKKNYNKDSDKTIAVLPIVFNQFEKDWVAKPFRSLFPQFSPKTARFLLEFDYLVINLASLPDEIMASLDEFGTLKAALLAMKHVRNKRFLKKHFKEIFLFLQRHPEKVDLRDQLITYVLGQSDVSVEDLQELLHNIFSPTITEEMVYTGNGFIAVAYREAAAQERERLEKKAEKLTEKLTKKLAEKAKKERALDRRLTAMRIWNSNISIENIADFTTMSESDLRPFIAKLETAKKAVEANPDMDFKQLKTLSKLDEAELTALLALLKRK